MSVFWEATDSTSWPLIAILFSWYRGFSWKTASEIFFKWRCQCKADLSQLRIWVTCSESNLLGDCVDIFFLYLRGLLFKVDLALYWMHRGLLQRYPRGATLRGLGPQTPKPETSQIWTSKNIPVRRFHGYGRRNGLFWKQIDYAKFTDVIGSSRLSSDFSLLAPRQKREFSRITEKLLERLKQAQENEQPYHDFSTLERWVWW